MPTRAAPPLRGFLKGHLATEFVIDASTLKTALRCLSGSAISSHDPGSGRGFSDRSSDEQALRTLLTLLLTKHALRVRFCRISSGRRGDSPVLLCIRLPLLYSR